MKGKWKRRLSFLLAIIILFTSEIIPELSVKVQAENGISKMEGSSYPYYCETCGFYYTEKESHKERISCTICNNTGKTLCTLCKATGKLYCGQEGTYTETITQGQEIPSGMMDSATHIPIGTKVPTYHNWKCNICKTTGTWTYWTYYNVPGVVGDDDGIHPTNTSAHTYSSMSCTQCNGTGQYGGQCISCNGLGSREDSSFCISKWKYRVVFDENEGNCDTKSGYYAGGCALPSASKEGYRFLGWNTDPSSSTGNGSVFITAPTKYYAIFEKLGTAMFIDMEGARSVTANSLLNKIYAPSIRTGDYSGIGWAEQTEPDSSIVENFQNKKTYYARYQTYAAIEYHMGKDEKGKDYAGSSEKPQGDYGHIIVNANAYNMEEWQSSSSYLMAKEPEWKGHTFLGWSDGNNIYASGEYVKLQKPVTVFTALWKLKSNKILLDSTGATSNGDTFVEAIAEEMMPDIIPPKKEYTITFHKNAEDSNIVMDNTLLKNNYLFHGYYTSSNGNGVKYYNEDGISTRKWDKAEDIILYAFWTNEGITLPTARRKGYLFQGWSISSNAREGLKAGTNYKAEEDINFYAIWKKETYSIQYHLANGILLTENPDSYHIDTETFTLNNPTRVGYTFLGWTEDNGTIPEKNIQIAKGTIGNKNYTANWSAETNTPYEVIIHKETLNGDYLDSSTDVVIKKKGISDTMINAEEIAKTYKYEGFSYSYAKIQDSIAGNKKGFQMNIDGDGTAKLHLYYTRNQYQLTIGAYDKNQLTTNNTNTTLLYGEKIKLKASLLSGYKFSHWDSGNTNIQPDLKTANATMIMVASDISMTPVAEEITYTVEFKANDTNSHTPENNVRATQVPNAQEYNYNEEFSMPVCIREGFRFLGWSTSKNGSELWSAGTKVSRLSTIDKAVVKLYAQWEENKYSIQFHANDGAATAHNPSKNVQATGSMDVTKSYYYTDNILLPSSGFTRTGFTFLGWSLAKDSNAIKYKSGDLVHNLSSINNSVITLYAAWSEKSYPIIFQPGDLYCYGTEKGTSARVFNPQAMDTVRVYYTDGFTMPACSYIRDGFTFVGWSKNKKASEITYTDTSYQGELQTGDSIPNLDFTEEHIYYPVWREHQYKIIYHSNENKDLSKTENIVSRNIYYTEDFRLAKGGFNRMGFTLRGWSTEKEGNSVSYAKGEMVLKLTVDEVIDLYAVWKENSYRISFQPNDDYCYGTKDGMAIKVSNPDAMNSLEIKYTEEAFFPECDYIREGFTFLGWSENKMDSLKTYEEDISVIKPGTPIHSLSGFNDDELVYYPIWKEHQYSIHFDKNDENNAREPANEPKAEGVTADIENIYYTQEVNLTRNKFTRIGFDYKGWSDTKGSNSYKYHDRESIRRLSSKDGSTIVLYAAWSEHSYTIHFKPADNYCYNLENNVKVSNPDSMQPIVLKYTENWNAITNYKRTGFTFLGYSNTNDNQQIYEECNVQFPANQNINRLSTKNHDEFIIYTIWKENTYKVYFNSNDSNNAKNPNKETKAEGITIETENIYYTEKFDLPKNHFKRKGFTFLGWSNKESDHTVIWEDSEKCQKLSNIDEDIVNLYAVWLEHQYTISFDTNDDYCYGTENNMEAKVSNPNDREDITVYYTEDYILPECNYIRKGFMFKGWTVDKNDVKKLYPNNKEYDKNYQAPYQAGDTISRLEKEDKDIITFYPVWEEISYGISFHANDRENTHTMINGSKVEGTMENIKRVYYTEEIVLPKNKFIRIGFMFKGWRKEEKENLEVYRDEEKLSRITEENNSNVTLYAIWSLMSPEIIEQTKGMDLGKEIKPNIPITISVSAIGLDIHYQWYYMDKMQTSGIAIENAIDKSYTIPAEEIIEENDGRSYYCILKNESGQIKSEPITLSIYGTPSIPAILDSGVNKYGWSNKEIQITLSGSTIKGSKKQVGYLYSFDKVTWLEYKELIWKENTLPDGKTLYFCAYNKECTKLKSPIITYTVKKDDENPKIMKINSSKPKEIIEENRTIDYLLTAENTNRIENSITTKGSIITGSSIITKNAITIETETITDSSITTLPEISEIFTEMTTKTAIITESSITEIEELILNNTIQGLEQETYPITIYAKDGFSGIISYAVTTERPSEKDWQEQNTFEVSTGTYYAYVMDMAGNITKQEFTVYAGGYILLSESSGSYSNENISYVVGEGIANWDNHSNIDKSKITHIIIQDGITEIPNGFFEGFINLKEVTIPDSVIKIGENAFSNVPDNMVIHASKGSEGEKAAKEYHYTEYDINLINTTIHVHYHEKISLPKEEMESDGKTLVGWGTKPEEREFEREEEVKGLSDEMNGVVFIYPIYTDAYIDNDGKLHITGDNTKYLDDIILNKDNIKEIIIESGVTILPTQIPADFLNLMDLTLPETLNEVAGKLNDMPKNSVIHAPEGSKAAEEAEKLHNTKYTIKIEGINEEMQGHYYDKMKLPETAPKKEGYLFIGWGTAPEEKEFEPGEIVYGLSKKPDGIVVLYPIYKEYKQEKEELEEKNPSINNSLNNSFPVNSNKTPNNTEISIYKEEEQKEDQKYNDWKEIDIIKTPEINKEQHKGYYKINEKNYDSLEDIFDQVQEIDSNGKKTIYANGENIILDDLKIPENVEILVNGTLVIQGDLTLLGELVIEKTSEVIIEGSIIAEESSQIYVNGNLRINGDFITNGCFYISETGILTISTDGNCEILSKGIFENNGTIWGTVNNHSKEESIITMKTKFSSIIIKKGKQKIKPLKGVTKWKIKNEKIASVKKKKGNLILTGKKKGKTILIGKTKKYTYQYIIVVKEFNNNQVKLITTEKKKNRQWILTKKGIIIRKTSINSIEGKIQLKLLKAGKNVKWKLLGKETLKGNGNIINVVIGTDTNYILKVKYKGKQYQCTLYRE